MSKTGGAAKAPKAAYMEKLEEFIYDVQRTVTARWLSREMAINLASAKTLLRDFVEAEKSKPRFQRLKIFWVISGLRQADGLSYDVVIVPAHKLEDIRKTYVKALVDVYCIFPADGAVGPAASIVNANSEHALENSQKDLGKFDGIRSAASANVRSNEELEQLRSNAFESGKSLGFTKIKDGPLPPPKKTPANAMANFLASKPKDSGASSSGTAEEKKPAVPQTTASDSAPGPSSAPQHAEAKKKVAPVPPKNSLTAMFSRQAEKNKVNPPKPKPEVKPEPTKVKEEEDVDMDVEVVGESKKADGKAQKRQGKKPGKKEQPPPKKPKKLYKKIVAVFSDSDDDSYDEEAEDKKRRREMEEPMEEDEEAKPTPDLVSSDDEDEVIPGTPQMSAKPAQKAEASGGTGGGKYKVKKWVDKTFLDEDGFMVTQKVMETVEVDEEPQPEKKEEEKKPAAKAQSAAAAAAPPDKENVKKTSPAKEEEEKKGRGRPAKKTASKGSGKQQSIMSFFTKAK